MSVYTAKTDSLSALVLQQIYKIFIDLTRKDHLGYVYRFLIGNSQTSDKLGLFADLGKHLGDLRSAAVNEDYLDPYEREQNYVAHYRVLELIVYHSVSAVFDHDYFVIILLDIRQRLSKYIGALCYTKFHTFFFSPLKQTKQINERIRFYNLRLS